MRAMDDEGNTGMPFAARNGHVAAMALLRDAGVHFFMCFLVLFMCRCFSVFGFFVLFFRGNFQFFSLQATSTISEVAVRKAWRVFAFSGDQKLALCVFIFSFL